MASRLREIIPNFRVVSGTKLYRSSRPDKLTNSSNILLLGRCSIKSIIDLRSKTELPPETMLDSYYRRVNETKNIAKMHKKAEKMEKNNKDKNYIGKHYNFQLIDMSYVKLVMRRLPFVWRIFVYVLFVFDKVFGTIRGYKTIVGRVLNNEGCGQLYVDIITASGDGLVQALRPLCDMSNVPSLICCSWGKDRTGILSALIQELCGVKREVILQEYEMSEKVIASTSLNKQMFDYLKRFGLHERYAEAKRAAMEEMFAALTGKFGSVAEYLQLHGLTKEELAKIVENVKC